MLCLAAVIEHLPGRGTGASHRAFLGLVLGSTIVASRLVRRADRTTVVIAAATPVAVFVLLALRQQTTSEAADVATDLALHGGEGGPWALAKHDVTTGARQLRPFAPEQLPSEAVYVAGTGATDEDAGYHVTVISSGDQSPAELLVFGSLVPGSLGRRGAVDLEDLDASDVQPGTVT